MVRFASTAYRSTGSTANFVPSLCHPHPSRQRTCFRGNRTIKHGFCCGTIGTMDNNSHKVPMRRTNARCIFGARLRFGGLARTRLKALLVILNRSSGCPVTLGIKNNGPVNVNAVAISVRTLRGPRDLGRHCAHCTVPRSGHLASGTLGIFIRRTVRATRHNLIRGPRLRALIRVLG